MKNITKITVAMLATVSLLLSGCSATYTAINKRNLDVQTKMSDTIFLEPVTSDLKVVYLQIRNTSDKPELTIEPQIRSAIESKGYRLTDDPDKAHYMIQANILQVGKQDNKQDADKALTSSFGSGIVGAAIGASAFGGGNGRMATGAIGSLLAVATDALVKDVYFTMITDLQVSEKVTGGETVTESNHSKLHQGTSGYKTSTSSKKTQWSRYQTRIVSVANKANLKFETALPELKKGLVNSISGML